MSSQLLMDAKLVFPSTEAIAQFVRLTNVKNVFVQNDSIEGVFSEQVVDIACSVFKAAVIVMPYYLSGTTFNPYTIENLAPIAE